MDNFIPILKWLSQGSILLGGSLSIYWFQFTEEGKRFWNKKINNMKSEEEYKAWTTRKDKLTKVIKHGSILLKLWLLLYSIFLASIAALVFISLTN